MIEQSPELAALLESSRDGVVLRVESWKGDELLATDIPFSSGSEEARRLYPERVKLTLPRVANGFNWAPGDDNNHPLATNGQRLRIEISTRIVGDRTEHLQRGWFYVHETKPSGDTVTVEARGLLGLIEEARLINPFQPTGTYMSTLRWLLEPTLPVIFDAGVVNKNVPAGINYTDDRLGAVDDLMTAWGVEGRVTEDGVFYVTSMADLTYSPVITLTEDVKTVIRATGTSTREGAYNAYVARGATTDGTPVQGVVYDESGPKGYKTDFNPMPVPFYYESPLLTTESQAKQAAVTIMTRVKRRTNQSFEVEMVPHPALQVGDVVSLNTRDFSNLLCTIEVLNLPLDPDGSIPMTLIVRTIV